jgi:hypothetical protein
MLTGNGNMTSSAKKAISAADTCVWVCCGFVGDASDSGCPTTDLCP